VIMSAQEVIMTDSDTGRRPDVLIILADDLGYSDVGCYGSEIDTPNLDALATAGVRMSQFYNTARCSPSRASLLTGLHPHQTGIGVLTRNDVLKALQFTAKQPQMSETFPNLIMSHFREERKAEDLVYLGDVTPQMTNHLGTIASGIMTTVMVEAACNLLRQHRRGDMVPENVTVYFLKPVQMESQIEVLPRLLDISRRFGKVEVSVYHGEQLVGQAMVTAQIIER